MSACPPAASGWGAGGVGVEAPAAAAAGAGTPQTNRGCQKPVDTLAWGRVDYLKLTVHAPVDEVLDRVQEGIVDRWFADEFEGWLDLGPGGRCKARWMAVEGLYVLEYIEGGWCTVELKGSVCAFVGNEGVAGLLADFAHVRSCASRCDIAWDGVPFDVQTVREAAAAGNVRTRLKLPAVPQYFESEEGTTVYVGRRTSERFIRVYDRRGPVRLELELKGSVAAVVVGELSESDPAEWPRIALGHLRGTLDFVDASAADDNHSSRRPLLPWWAAFVEGEEKRSAGRKRVDRGITELGKLDGVIKRFARRLEAARRAYGDQWLLDRITYWVRQMGGDAEINAMAEELERWRGTGVAGAPEWLGSRLGDDVPF